MNCASVSTPSATRLHAELVSEIYDGADGGEAGGVLVDAGDERPVDLDGVDGKLVKDAEGRVAGAEVVDGDRDAEVLQGLKALRGFFEAGDDEALPSLSNSRRGGRQPAELESVADGSG